MTTLTHDDFHKPAPGTWTWDHTHQTRPHPRLVQGILREGMDEGFRRAFENVGALLDRIETRHVHGWCYQAVRPVGAPPEPKGPPPRLIFKLLTMLHPEIRRRIRRSREIWTEKPWLAAAKQWQEVEPKHRASLLALQARGWEDAPVDTLRSRLVEALDLTTTILHDHFVEAVPSGVPVGDLFVQAEERYGIPVTRTSKVLAGASHETARPTRMMLEILGALEETDDLDLLDGDDPQSVLDTLLAHPAAGPRTREFVDEYAYRALEFHVDAAETLIERPDVLIATLRGLRTDCHLPDVDPGLAAAAAIRSDSPPSAHEWWDETVSEARTSAANRETSANLVSWGAGLVRLFALELGRRLHASGDLPDPEAIFHVGREELANLPDAAELTRRMADHRAAAKVTPPRVIGALADPPPLEWLPEPTARLERAVQAYISRFDATPDLEDSDDLRGLGVSSGKVSGQVFLLRDIEHLELVPPGCILVAKSTSPTLNPVLPIIGGLVTELGGLICHAAIMSRELGFPGVVGCPNVTAKLEHGSWVEIDGESGEVTLLDGPPAGHELRTPASRSPAPVEQIEPRLPKAPGVCAELTDAGDVSRFGGKAARLAAAVRAGHRVPAGVALDVDFVEAVAAGDDAHVARLAEAVAGLRGPLAVRSSAPAEDGSRASFAGMHHTELGVSADDVAEAVVSVWRSGVAPAARAYRARLGVEGRPQMAVLIQELVSADASGVRFGRDPVTGENIRIVECAPGLGALVVDGKVKPDRVRLDADGRVLERTKGDIPIKLVPAKEGGVHEVAVSPEEAAHGPLDNGVLHSVHLLGEACDALFEGAQDVEWAVERDEVWLLQSRPVTTGGE